MATMTLDLTAGKSGASSGERPVLPGDNYRMKIVDVAMRENRLEKPAADGTFPLQVSITWEISGLTDDQREAQDEAGEDWSDVRVWQDVTPWYGDTKSGSPSKFKALLDAIREAGYLPNFVPSEFDIGALMGVEMKVMLKVHIRTQGANTGKPINRVVSVAPLKKKKAAAAAEAPLAPLKDDETF